MPTTLSSTTSNVFPVISATLPPKEHETTEFGNGPTLDQRATDTAEEVGDALQPECIDDDDGEGEDEDEGEGEDEDDGEGEDDDDSNNHDFFGSSPTLTPSPTRRSPSLPPLWQDADPQSNSTQPSPSTDHSSIPPSPQNLEHSSSSDEETPPKPPRKRGPRKPQPEVKPSDAESSMNEDASSDSGSDLDEEGDVRVEQFSWSRLQHRDAAAIEKMERRLLSQLETKARLFSDRLKTYLLTML